MGRLGLRSFLVVAIVAAVLLSWLGAPRSVSACSCPETRISDYAGKPDIAVFVGTAGRRVGDNVPVRVEAWFQGPDHLPFVLTSTGETTDPTNGMVIMNSCGVQLEAGVRWIVVASVDPRGGPLTPASCFPVAPLDTPAGQEMLAEATRAYGAPEPPGIEAVSPEPSIVRPPPAASNAVRGEVEDGEEPGISPPVLIVIAVALGGVVLLVPLLMARRRVD